MATAKSPLALSSPHHNPSPSYHASAAADHPASMSRSTGHANSYFPQQSPLQQQQQQHHLQLRHLHHSTYAQPSHPAAATAADNETRSNTIANSNPQPTPLLAPVAIRPTKFTEEWDTSQHGDSVVDGVDSASAASYNHNMQRSNSFSGSIGPAEGSHPVNLSRGNTLKKKPSLRRGGSLKRSSTLKRSGSRRSMKAGSVRSLALQSSTDPDEMHSAFFCPVPTTGNPTEVLANRFQAWRKILKDLISYFREIQTHYEHRSKSLLKLANVLNNTSMPQGFLASGGLVDALQILRNYNKLAVLESNKAREIEEDVILALAGLRSDLHQKIKEIKNLSGDFKNSVDKEMEATRRAVKHLQEVLGQTELDSTLATGKQDPYLLRLGVDRQLERQIDEENYLHQAYLNLENSGRELESIVVGEIQKSYNAYAGILKREAEAAYSAIEELRIGPIAMPKDYEWTTFVQQDDQFMDPNIPIRSAEFIHYPGRDHYACQEIRAGLLERKSKYLKSYTAGWYVLSPTHLHEFKSADKTQAPVMSLYLPEQKLGSHSVEGGSSNKFILKGRQTGTMHRGHTWVFRAESHDTMMAWYEDIKALTEKSPEERSSFVRGHSRSFSRSSQRSFSSDGVVDDDDDEPFAASTSINQQQPKEDGFPRRPEPGGRFPSDLQVNAQRGLQVPLSPSSVSSSVNENSDQDVLRAAAALPGTTVANPPHLSGANPGLGYRSAARTPIDEASSHGGMGSQAVREDRVNADTSDSIYHGSSSNYKPEVFVVVGRQASGVGVGAPQRLSSRSSAAGGTSMVDAGKGVENRPSQSQGEISLEIRANLANGKQAPLPEAVDGLAIGPPSSSNHQQPLEYETYAAKGSSPAGGADLTAGSHYQNNSGYISGPSQKESQANGPMYPMHRNDSVPTLSNLHVPGEYPKGTTPGLLY